MHKSKWNEQQQARVAILFRMFPKLEEAYNIYLELVDIFNRKSRPEEARLNLDRWYNKAEAFGDEGFSKVIETFENHNAIIVNYFEDRLTNASAESLNAKNKAFRTQFRGVGDIRFFMCRIATLYSWSAKLHQPEKSADPKSIVSCKDTKNKNPDGLITFIGT